MSIFTLLALITVAVIVIKVRRWWRWQTEYFKFENVIITDDRGSTEIDVIVVGRAGVFVIELKDFNAWIFGEENAERWTACYLDKSRHPFQNPLRQNFRHIKALEARLGLDFQVFQSIVAFTGKCELKTPLPDNVIVGGYRSFIEQFTEVVLTEDDVRRICDTLNSIEAASDSVALEQHVAGLKERFGSDTTCPKCGSALVERRSKAEWNEGEQFLGCRAYPRCKFIKKLGAT